MNVNATHVYRITVAKIVNISCPWLSSAAYLSIYLEHSKISPENRDYCVNVTKRCRSKLIKAALD